VAWNKKTIGENMAIKIYLREGDNDILGFQVFWTCSMF
jgi:hypothetical protein